MEHPDLETWKGFPKKDGRRLYAISILASRDSGKTYLLKHLLRKWLNKAYDLYVVISESPDTEMELGPVLPEHTIYLTEMDYDLIDKFDEENAKRIGGGEEALTMCIIYDDAYGIAQSNKYDRRLTQVYLNGRHCNKCVIFSTQAKKNQDTSAQANSDYVFLLKANSYYQKEIIIKQLVMGTITADSKREQMHLAEQAYQKYTSERGDVLVIDNRERSTDNLYQYRAP
jgi:hypothetical protein